MAEGSGPGPGVESPRDFPNPVSYWNEELRAAERTLQNWRDDASRIVDRYTLEKRTGRASLDTDDALTGDFNVLASNISTMLPAVFGREPIPVVFRRHADRDPIGRVAAQILERSLKTELEHDYFETTMKSVTQDLLLCARGVSWVRYEPVIVQVQQIVQTEALPVEGVTALEQETVTEEQVADAKTPMDYVLWTDFLHSPKSSWAEVKKDGWVARRILMTRDQGLQRFGEVFQHVTLGELGPGMEDREMSDEMKEVVGRAAVWEIWDASTRRVIWICRTYDRQVLEEMDDPLGLDGFFPCPMPAFGMMDNRKLIPVPDYLQYEKLANEMDDQTRRISVLTSALRVVGVYDSSIEGLGALIEALSDEGNKMVPITNWAAVEGGKIDNHISWMPLKDIAEALIALYNARDRTKAVLDEVSGQTDLSRGQLSNQYEKLGQTRMRAASGSTRLQSKIRVVEACAKETLAIKAEIMAEHYPPDVLRQLSGYDFLPEVETLREQARAMAEQMQAEWQQAAQQAQAQMMPPPPPPQFPPDPTEELFQRAIQLLRDEKMRGFRLDVETNSTVLEDDDQEKQRRTEFVDAVGSFAERALPMMTQIPETAPMLLDSLMFTVRGFRGGRQLESSIETTVEKIRQSIQQSEQQAQQQAQQPPQPDPAQMAAEAEAQAQQQKTQMELQATAAKTQGAIQVSQAQTQNKVMEAALERQGMVEKARADQAKAETQAAMTEMEITAKLTELDIEREKLFLKRREMQDQAMIEIATQQEAPGVSP